MCWNLPCPGGISTMHCTKPPSDGEHLHGALATATHLIVDMEPDVWEHLQDQMKQRVIGGLRNPAVDGSLPSFLADLAKLPQP